MPASGLLLWGQGGNYDAIEDRSVLAVLTQGRTGLVVAPTLTALPGLVVGLGPWGGVADCEDRTVAVIGSRETQSVDIAAGGAAPRRDVIWADIDPDAGSWEGNVYAEGATAGRAGLLLGTVVVPAGANNSSVMDLIPARPARWGGGLAEPARTNPGNEVTGTAWGTLFTGTIPGGDPGPGSVYEIEVWGNGTHPTGNRRTLNFRIALGGNNINEITFGTVAFSTNTGIFRWHCKVRAIRRATDWQASLEATLTMNENLSGGNTHHAFDSQAGGSYSIDPANDIAFNPQASWGPSGGGNAPSLVPRLGFYRKIAG